MYNVPNTSKSRFGAILFTALLTLSMLTGSLLGVLPAQTVYAAHALKVESIGDSSATQGQSASVRFRITNLEGSSFTFDGASLGFSPSQGITVSGTTGSTTLNGQNASTDITFDLQIGRQAEAGSRDYTLILTNGGTEVFRVTKSNFYVYESMAAPGDGSGGGKYTASVDITHQLSPADGLVPGNGNTITFEVFNKGNTVIKDAAVSLTLPDGLAIYNDSNSMSLGYLSIGGRKKVTFPVHVSDKAESKNYTIDVKVTGLDYSNGEVSSSKSFYIPVKGVGSGSLQKVSITGISAPAQVEANKDFTLSFTVQNSGTAAINDLIVAVEPEEGILNKTQALFSEKTLGAGQSKSYTVTLFAKSGEGKNVPIKMKIESAGASGQSVVQYTGVYVGGDASGIKTPQLMISNYNYGGDYVEAGSAFGLSLTLYNTSPKTLKNIKVKIDSADGVFTPLGSSNSFYVETIPAKSSYSKKIDLSVKPLAEQKTTPLTVSMSYEDGSANGFTAEETIAIPIMQENRLTVENIVPPYELYVGQQASAEIKFINMGKSVINNLKVDVAGDFDTFESTSYYVGNMDAGKSDSYSFNFSPRAVGPVTGVVTFSFEDGAGKPQTIEVPFEFTALEFPEIIDPGMEEPKAAFPWKLVIAGGAVLAAIVGDLLFRRHRKKKLHARMQLEDEAFADQLDREKEEEE